MKYASRRSPLLGDNSLFIRRHVPTSTGNEKCGQVTRLLTRKNVIEVHRKARMDVIILVRGCAATTLLALTITTIISVHAAYRADFKKLPLQISPFFLLDTALAGLLILLLLLAFYGVHKVLTVSRKTTLRWEEAQQPAYQPVTEYPRLEVSDHNITQGVQPENFANETYHLLEDALNALNIRTDSATNHPSSGQVVLTVDYIPQFDIRTLQKAVPALRSPRAAFYVDEHLRVLCIIGNNAFCVKACSENYSKSITTKHIQIVFQPRFPQGMQILERRAYFKHD
ncbi:MAG: hypothetical protein ACTJLL_00480, partial [Anaplasma sp.]